MNEKTSASTTLSKWLDDGRMTRQSFAFACGVSRQTVYKWQNGEVRPAIKQQHRIEFLTDGIVSIHDWLTADEKVEVTKPC